MKAQPKAYSCRLRVGVARIALLSAVLVLLAPATAGRAQTSTSSAPAAPGAPVGVHLVYQSSWVPTGGKFVMLLHVDDPELAAAPGAAIAIRVYRSMTTRTAFDQAVTNNELSGILDQPNRIPLSSIPRLNGELALTLGLPGSDASSTIGVNRPGVYPVEVSLTNTGTATGSFVTWLVVVDTSSLKPIDKPLLVSLVWQLGAPPARLPDGTTDPAVAALMRPDGRLDRIATVLGASAAFPLSLSISPESVSAWADLARHEPAVAPGLARVRAAAQDPAVDLLPAPYVPIDGPALEAAGLGPNLPDQYALGARTLQDVLGATPLDRPLAAFVDPASDAAVDRLRQMLVTRVAVRDSSLVPADHPFTPAQGFTIETAGGRSQGVATAPFVERMLSGTDPAPLKVARVIAALAEVAYETPAIERGLLLASPSPWSPDVDAMTTLVDALRDFPLAQPVTLDDLFSRISTEQVGGSPVERQLRPMPPNVSPVTAADYEAAAQHLHAFESVVGRDDPAAVAGERALTTALSTALTPERARAQLEVVDRSVTSFTNAVTVSAKRITLTSRRSQVPLTFDNKLKRTVRVRVHLASTKLLFPLGDEPVIDLRPGNTTLRDEKFTVEARTSGTFPMDIWLTSEDNQLQFGSPVRATVRSAVFGGFAVALTVGALVFLALWWGNHLRRARKAGRRSLADQT